MGYILALEGGGTRSQAVLVDEAGQVRGRAFSRDVNTNFTAWEQARQAVQEAARQALLDAHAAGEEVAWLVSALVGPKFGAETYGELCPRASYCYYGESQVIFARAGFYRPHGVAVVSATGATAWVMRQDDGRKGFFGGWGSLLGDEGSAYALGLAALRAAARAYEGRIDQPTRLPEAIAAHFEIELADFRGELVRIAYGRPLTRAEIAALAPLATSLAESGDPIAARITAQTAEDLAGLALHAARCFFAPQESFPLVAAGGMVAAGDLILGSLRRQLARDFPQASLVIGNEDPAVSLARLALYDLNTKEG